MSNRDHLGNRDRVRVDAAPRRYPARRGGRSRECQTATVESEAKS